MLRSSSVPKTIHAVLHTNARRFPDAPALLAEGRTELTYGALAAHVDHTAAALRSIGIGREDHIAIVLPNGPEMASAFLSVASCATAAPLNPSYQAPEYDFYLSDLGARALLVEAGSSLPAVDVAAKRGIPILELSWQAEDPAGSFTIAARHSAPGSEDGFAEPDDTALILHTSGTTSRPKIVPLSHQNLVHSAASIQAWLGLAPADRSLNVMPLFHVHGLLASLLASLYAGASVVCTPGFLAPYFFNWLEAFRPTWYTAVPTMHQAVLARAAGQAAILSERTLRFIRSCSASLPPQVMDSLEKTFQVPVVEAYGMTEASHQMTCNPLPPGERKPGSVGLPAGAESAIMDDGGNLLPAGEEGEIVIRGGGVTAGYENNPEANRESFTAGWFRTGDLGYLDNDGYLFISGRKKEVINRGGEKITPREVDEVLLSHPDVAQAVAFAVPHTTLGEEVGAAVVLKAGADLDEQTLRRFAALTLAPFKVPAVVVFVDEIPKGPTGKLQRIGLADKLDLPAVPEPESIEASEHRAPSTPVEERLFIIWCEVLGIETCGVEDRFLALGGDSMLAAQIVSRVRAAYGMDVSMVDFFDTPTITGMAAALEAKIRTEIDSMSDDEVRRWTDES